MSHRHREVCPAVNHRIGIEEVRVPGWTSRASPGRRCLERARKGLHLGLSHRQAPYRRGREADAVAAGRSDRAADDRHGPEHDPHGR